MTAEPIRAPEGAVAWTPSGGWVYDVADLPSRVTDGQYVLVVSHDSRVLGVPGTAVAPLQALLRVDADVTGFARRISDLDVRLAGIDTSEALDVAELRSHLAAIGQRVARPEGAL